MSRQTSFLRVINHGKDTGLLACERRGALVHNSTTRLHATWHAAFDDIQPAKIAQVSDDASRQTPDTPTLNL